MGNESNFGQVCSLQFLKSPLKRGNLSINNNPTQLREKSQVEQSLTKFNQFFIKYTIVACKILVSLSILFSLIHLILACHNFMQFCFIPRITTIFITLVFAYGHTSLNTPVLVCSPKISRLGPGQQVVGRLHPNTGCCKHFFKKFNSKILQQGMNEDRCVMLTVSFFTRYQFQFSTCCQVFPKIEAKFGFNESSRESLQSEIDTVPSKLG